MLTLEQLRAASPSELLQRQRAALEDAAAIGAELARRVGVPSSTGTTERCPPTEFALREAVVRLQPGDHMLQRVANEACRGEDAPTSDHATRVLRTLTARAGGWRFRSWRVERLTEGTGGILLRVVRVDRT